MRSLNKNKRLLNSRFVETVNKPGKYHDRYGTGLLLRVDKYLSKYWVQRITIDGKRCDLGLGSFPIISLAKARDKALVNKQKIVSGIDPRSEHQQKVKSPTFEAAAYEVFELNKPIWTNPKHARQFISTLETYAFPTLARKRLDAITAKDIMSVLTPIWNTKAETARRVKQRIGTVMKWGVTNGYCLMNPAEHVKQALPKQAARVQNRKALHFSQVGECIQAIRNSGAALTTKLGLELLILTAVRSGEVRFAQWSEFELEATQILPVPVWRIPADRMKMKREHLIPLSDQAIDVIRKTQVNALSSRLVFPGSKPSKPLSDMTFSKLVKELGFDADVHGFRTSFKTWAQEKTNYPDDLSEVALAHSIGSQARQAYARSNLIEKRQKMMQDWADYVFTSYSSMAR